MFYDRRDVGIKSFRSVYSGADVELKIGKIPNFYNHLSLLWVEGSNDFNLYESSR